MKKGVTFILLLMIVLIPIIIFADLNNYAMSINKANNYITSERFKDRSKYLLIRGGLPFEYSDSLKSDSRFYNGALLNKKEYELSIRKENSYLSTGLEYWTMTNASGDHIYFIENFLNNKSKNETSGTRVTEFVKKETKVSGSGTYVNPWVFDDTPLVIIRTNSLTYGSIEGELYKEKQAERIMSAGVFVRYTQSFDLIPKPGFKYMGHDGCGLVKANEDPASNTYKILNISGDMDCTAIFGAKIFTLVLDKEETFLTKHVEPKFIYYKYMSGWFNDSDTTDHFTVLTQKPEKIGYSFDGYYYTDTSGNKTDIINSDGNLNTSLGNNTTIFNDLPANQDKVDLDVKWKANIYKVKLDPTPGTGGTSEIYVRYGDGWYTNSNATNSLTAITKPTRAGYTFDGYYTSSGELIIDSDGKPLGNTNKLFTTNDTVLVSKWKSNTYTITYYLGNGNSAGGSTKIGESTCEYNGNCTLTKYSNFGTSFPLSTSSGCTYTWAFGGWTTTETGTNIIYNDNQSFTYESSNNMNLYAVGKRTLSFAKGKAPSSYSTQLSQRWNPYSTSDSYVTSVQIPTSESISGWTFLGYKAGSDVANSTVTYNSSDVGQNKTPSVTTCKVYRSVYKRDGVTLTYDGNGSTSGSTSSSTLTQYYNSGIPNNGTNKGSNVSTPSFTLRNNGFSKTGYSFSKWASGSTSGTEYAEGSTYTGFKPEVDTTNITQTMYAKWNAIEYTITLTNTNATTNGSTSVKVKYNNTITATITNPVRSYTVTYSAGSSGATIGKNSDSFGYTFDGWFTEQTNGTRIIDASGKLVSNVSGYTNSSGKWIKTSGATLYAHWKNGAHQTTSATRTGYVCVWNNSSGTKVADSLGNYTATSNVTLTASCSPNKFNVAYSANGGSGTTPSHQCTYDAACTLAANKFTRSGYTFNGWFKQGTTTYKKPGDSIKNASSTNNATVTYNAKWCDNCVDSTYCRLNASNPGTCSYDADCPSGYTKTGSGKDVTCKQNNTSPITVSFNICGGQMWEGYVVKETTPTIKAAELITAFWSTHTSDPYLTSSNPPSITVIPGQAYGNLLPDTETAYDITTRTGPVYTNGMTFIGWNDTECRQITQDEESLEWFFDHTVNSETIVTKTTSHTLYASYGAIPQPSFDGESHYVCYNLAGTHCEWVPSCWSDGQRYRYCS